jgi:hypothetical protein
MGYPTIGFDILTEVALLQALGLPMTGENRKELAIMRMLWLTRSPDSLRHDPIWVVFSDVEEHARQLYQKQGLDHYKRHLRDQNQAKGQRRLIRSNIKSDLRRNGTPTGVPKKIKVGDKFDLSANAVAIPLGPDGLATVKVEQIILNGEEARIDVTCSCLGGGEIHKTRAQMGFVQGITPGGEYGFILEDVETSPMYVLGGSIFHEWHAIAKAIESGLNA